MRKSASLRKPPVRSTCIYAGLERIEKGAPDESGYYELMKVPSAENAIIAPEKLRNYLLNPEHRRGRSKAKKLLSMGYQTEQWQRLETDLRQQHLTADIDTIEANDYGTSYRIVAELTGPNGDRALFRSIWQIDFGTDQPRLITMYPEW